MGTEMIVTLISAVSGLGGLTWIGSIIYRKQNKRLKDAEVKAAELANDKAKLEMQAAELTNEKEELAIKAAEFELEQKQREADARRIEQLHEALNATNETIKGLSETVMQLHEDKARLNAIIEDKVEQIRIERENLLKTERENTRLAEENGLLKEDMACHRCIIKPCGAREPKNEHTCAALENGTAIFPADVREGKANIDLMSAELSAVTAKKKRRRKRPVEDKEETAEEEAEDSG